MNAAWNAMPMIGAISAITLASRIPVPYASPASSSSARPSRSVAPAARMVRMPGIARATPAASAPTWVCACRVSFWIRPPRVITTTAARTTTSRVIPSSSGSSRAMATTEPTNDHHTGHGVDQTGGDDRTQQGGVRADPGHQVAGAAGVVLADRQPQQSLGHGLPGLQDHRLGGPLQQILLQPGQQRSAQHQADQQQDGTTQRTDLAHAGDDHGDHSGLGEEQGGRDQRDDHDEAQHPPVRTQIRPEGAQRCPLACPAPVPRALSGPFGALSQSKGPAPGYRRPSSSVPLVHGLPADP